MYHFMPQLGSFEVYGMFDNTVVLFFSKFKRRQWPAYNLLAQRMKNAIDDYE